MLFRPGNPDDRIHHHALDRDRQPNLGRDKSQIGVFGTDYTTPKTGIIRKSKCSTDFKRNDFLKKNEAYPLGALRSLKFAYRKLRISLFVELAV